MLGMIFETGHPWITFKDPCNVRSPQDHVGVIHSSNLCTEITLNTSAEETAVCNLGSVVLDSHLKADGSIDHAMLRETVTVAVRALDNVIDINFYPTKAAEVSNLRHRPVGMGVMGLQDCLYRRDISFASEAAVEFNDEIMEAVAYYAYDTSADLAAERGTYSTYKGSKWDRGLLPQDTVDLLEQERGEPIEVKRGGRMDWAPVRAKIAKQRHAQLQRPRHRPDRHDLQHRRQLALHRADLQEPLREEQPVRRVHRTQRLPGARPQEAAASGPRR